MTDLGDPTGTPANPVENPSVDPHTAVLLDANSILSHDSSYVVSDEEEVLGNNQYSSSLTHHAAYFSSLISLALDAIQLDKSLVIQAQLSGNLNNDTQLLMNKTKEVVDRLKQLQEQYRLYFDSSNGGLSKVEKLSRELAHIEARVDKVKYGGNVGKFQFLQSNKVGVVQKYPIEYNTARDRVIERIVDEQEDENDDIDF